MKNSRKRKTRSEEDQPPEPHDKIDNDLIEQDIFSCSEKIESSSLPPPSSPPPVLEVEPPKRKSKKKKEKIETNSEEESVPPPPAKKSKKTKQIDDFVMTQLPALKKDMKMMKKEGVNFHIQNYADYFKVGSKWKPTYCLRLFNFLQKNEFVCSSYGLFKGKDHMVKTDEGFNHCSFLSSACKDHLTPDENAFMFRRYGYEWFKIPAKDEEKAKQAMRFGDKHFFKCILVNIYEDSFFDKETGNEIFTINPVLHYEPYIAPIAKPKKEKKKEEATSSEAVDQPQEISVGDSEIL